MLNTIAKPFSKFFILARCLKELSHSYIFIETGKTRVFIKY
ncbi:hypothetical protein EV209_0159 [Cuneatibacter caecimuris]|uniref:Uncharacterized protein n=1 Tax=Cuneatibacter caecimuris TaxID=1796618 RepID=A0A4Q7PMI2_9FIRM|nr:hypothetical protein EV209_0159 [Cuneatibacter caecimuris]